MDVFILKMIATIFMIIDHVANVFGDWNIIPGPVAFRMHMIGRISFPVCAFLISNGWKNTNNKRKYFIRMTLFACISQIPYTLALFPVNKMVIRAGENASYYLGSIFKFYLMLNLLYIILCLYCYYNFALQKKKHLSILILSSALLLRLLLFESNYIWFLGDTSNVFYTLALGIYAIYCWDYFIPFRKHRWNDYLLLCSLLMSCLLLNIEYGVMGILLILALHIFKNKGNQFIAIIMWGLFTYGIINIQGAIYHNWPFFSCVLISDIILMFYNGKKGRKFKYLFYIIYPLHLAILGIINIYLRIGDV